MMGGNFQLLEKGLNLFKYLNFHQCPKYLYTLVFIMIQRKKIIIWSMIHFLLKDSNMLRRLMNCNLKFFKTGLLFCILILSFSCEESFGGILPVFPAIPET